MKKRYWRKNLREILELNKGILFNGDRMVMLPWSPLSTTTKVMRWTLERGFCWCRRKNSTNGFVGWKVKGIVGILVCWKNGVFFQIPCVFKFRVIAQINLSISDSSDRYASSTRELHLDSHRASEQLMFSCIDEGPMLHHMKLAWI